MYKLNVQKAEEPEVKLSTLIVIELRELKKKSTLVSLTMLKPLTVWITTNCGKFFKRWEY